MEKNRGASAPEIGGEGVRQREGERERERGRELEEKRSESARERERGGEGRKVGRARRCRSTKMKSLPNAGQ